MNRLLFVFGNRGWNIPLLISRLQPPSLHSRYYQRGRTPPNLRNKDRIRSTSIEWARVLSQSFDTQVVDALPMRSMVWRYGWELLWESSADSFTSLSHFARSARSAMQLSSSKFYPQISRVSVRFQICIYDYTCDR